MESISQNLLNELENIIKKRHKKYCIDFKLKAIKLIHLNISIQSNKLGIDRMIIRDSVKQESSLDNIKNKDSRYLIINYMELIKILLI